MLSSQSIAVVSVDDLKELIRSAVAEALTDRTVPGEERDNGVDEIIDRKELRKWLNVTEQTIIRWEKRGYIPSLRIGDAARYNWGAVLKALETKKRR